MKTFRKYQKSRAVKTIGYLNNSAAYNAGEEAGWKAALTEIWQHFMSHLYATDAQNIDEIENFIKRELEIDNEQTAETKQKKQV